MPVLVRFEEPDLFYRDDCPAHEILGRNGIQRGAYQVLNETPPMILLESLSIEAINGLRSSGPVQVDQVDD
ncbi:hypothetical protein BDV40DRAFT_304362 [Aspergillus tamarii]|uniref:Uncharacterized protein n=1 Tax=Aspergillus tamarii TaxID=41984 RepID=A0A5N6UIA2_ASPTM|nr:hypothetical protein BDV40DRAFT_304362 [Aspergillus tamarii]